MKRKAFILAVLICLFSITGCMVDYGVEYIYTVENKLDQPIEVHIETYLGLQEITINASSSKEIFRDSGLCGKHYVPEKYLLPFDLIDIYHDQNIKIDKDFKDLDFWTFTGIEYEARYVLVITASLL